MKFGDWLPDLPAFDNPGVITASGVYPDTNGYKPFPGATTISNALNARCRGVFAFKRTNGTLETFAASATKLFRLSGSTFNDVSKVGDYNASTSRWRFAIFGDIVIATNNIDTVQQFNVSSDSIFSDLSAAPIHSFPFVIRDFLSAADVNDGTIFQLKWSARNNSADWAADCGGGAQQFPDGGPVIGATGGEQGVVFQENALTRMVFVGGDLRFAFDKVEGANGCISAGSIVEHKGFSYYLSESGFQVFDGAQSINISEGKVADTFLAAFDRSKEETLQGALDLANKSIVWAYPTSAAATGTNDMLIIYHIPTGRWSEANFITQALFEDETSTGKVLAFFDNNHTMNRFTGSNLAAQIVTGESGSEQKTRVRSVRMDTDAAHTSTVSHRNGLQDSLTNSDTVTANGNGRCPIRTNDRYNRFRLDIAAAASWTYANGFDVEASPGGRLN